MMNALGQGLTEGGVIYRPDIEKFNKENEGYVPSPNGLWEVGPMYYLNPHFLRGISEVEGTSLIKIFFDGLPLLPKGEYKIIYMLRDVEEIQSSIDRVEGHLKKTGVSRVFSETFPFTVYRPYKQIDIDHVLGICEMRQDIDLQFVNYRDVIEDPLTVFKSLDMPIDVEKCAAVVKPELYRERNEHSKDGDEGRYAEGVDRQGRTEAPVRKAGQQ